jgi:ABC-type lipoprotein release transport system permease subunit
MRTLLPDCRHAIRLYARTPAASLIAVLVLAAGIAFVGAFVSLYVDLVLRSHPGFTQSDRLVTIGQNDGVDFAGIPFRLIERISTEMPTAEAAAMWKGASGFVEANPDDTRFGMVSDEFFDGLRPRLALGRGFRAEDHRPDAEPVIVLSNRYWQRQFGGDSGVLGAHLRISRNPELPYLGQSGSPFSSGNESRPEQESALFRVVGVGAETFRDIPIAGSGVFEPEIWVPIEHAWPLLAGVIERLPTSLTSGAYIRRAPGVPTTAIAEEIRTRYQSLEEELQLRPGTRLDAVNGLVGNASVQRNAARQLEMFLSGSVLLALAAAANVSLFLLARAPGRRRELAIRISLGAPMRRIRRQLVTEGALLVGASVSLGLFVSLWLSPYFQRLVLFRDAQWRNVTLLDWRVLSLVSLVVLILTLLVSLTPVLRLQREISISGRQVAARASLAQNFVGNAQIVVAGILSSAAIAFCWHLGLLIFGDRGYEMADRYFAQSSVNFQQFTANPETFSLETARWREAVEAIPGVTRVAFGGPVPGEAPVNFPQQISGAADPSREVEAYLGEVEEPFIDILDLKLLHGRIPEANQPEFVAVNQTLARLLWGREDAVGEVLIGDPIFFSERGSEVVGVLKDLSFAHPLATPQPYAFRGYANYSSAVIESKLTVSELLQALNRIETASGIRTSSVRSLETMHRELIAQDRVRGLLTIAASGLVVILAAFGFYGTQRYLVAAGCREYAIRASLGAGPKALARMVILRAFRLASPGLLGTGLMALIAVLWLRGDFISQDVSPEIVTLCVMAAWSFVLFGASCGPARTAKDTPPAQLLRED